MSLSIIENFSYHCKYKMRKLIKTVMINIGTWYTSKRHRYNDTLPKSSYPHYGKKVTGIIYHGTRKRKGHDTKESWDKENWITLWNIKTWMCHPIFFVPWFLCVMSLSFPCAMVNNPSHFLAIVWIGTLWKCVIISVPFRCISCTNIYHNCFNQLSHFIFTVVRKFFNNW